VKPALRGLDANFCGINTVTIADKLLADVLVTGTLCGLYLQYKGFMAMNSVPAAVERRDRALTRDEVFRLLASIGYIFAGALFEMISLTQAAFA
jgi:hypothetical protein